MINIGLLYDSLSNNPEYIPPKYSEIPSLVDELVNYVKELIHSYSVTDYTINNAKKLLN